jgi:hypothetical protein
MARLVRDPVITEAARILWEMPQLQGNALERYRACVNDRIEAFSSNKRITHTIPEDKKITYSHKLSYDAESILWLLL